MGKDWGGGSGGGRRKRSGILRSVKDRGGGAGEYRVSLSTSGVLSAWIWIVFRDRNSLYISARGFQATRLVRLCVDQKGCVSSDCAFFMLSYIIGFKRLIHILSSIAPVLSIQV